MNALRRRARWLATRLQFHLVPNDRQREVKRWGRDKGYHTHRLNYALTPDSIVLDLGGYQGQYASDLYGRFNCTVHVFEPMKKFSEDIERRFAHNPKIFSHPFGLGGVAATIDLSVDGAASSAYANSRDTTATGTIRPILDFMAEADISDVDLLKMNIEGGEYELLEFLLDKNEQGRFANIQIQFHDLFPGAKDRMTAIQKRLGKTHTLTFHYEFMMENWQRNASE